ncbi:MAG TPA: YncE family protein [Longimicrobiaceae bacterium]|nr:YncE family protein [Longimicrobiaceae bacterium]
MSAWRGVLGALAVGLAACTVTVERSEPEIESGYDILVATDSADPISRIRFMPGSGQAILLDNSQAVAASLNGARDLALSPDGVSLYASVGRGTPFGKLLRIDRAADSVTGQALLGLFPTTIDLTTAGEFAFVTNTNRNGEPAAGSVSKVHLPSMTEVARVQTCIGARGGRLDADGTRHYSVCMKNEVLVEIDAESSEISRLFLLTPDQEHPVARIPVLDPLADSDGPACSPTWVEPATGGGSVYVACSASDEILEIDTRSWTLARRIPTGGHPFQLAITPDGRYLLATLHDRSAPATTVIALGSGEFLARIPNTAPRPHGIAVSRDSRYAFVSVEGAAGAGGAVDIIDLVTLSRVASVAVGPRPHGMVVADGN